MTADPAALSLAPGQKQSLTFTITHPAPAGGLLLDVTTDVPESVIMPEVIVPEGQSSATVTVEGGKPVLSAREWPEYEPSRRMTKILGGSDDFISAPGEVERAFLDHVMPTYGGELVT